MVRAIVHAAVGVLAIAVAGAAHAQVAPAEWRNAGTALIQAFDAAPTPGVAPPPAGRGATTAELNRAYALARTWRLHNNKNTENILAEHLGFVLICRIVECAQGGLIAGRPHTAWAADVAAERLRAGGPDPLVDQIHVWLGGLASAGAAGADAQKNAAAWGKDRDTASADFATTNIYTLGWLVARRFADPQQQADAFNRLGLVVYGTGWAGGRCFDITRIAAVIDGPPKVETCR